MSVYTLVLVWALVGQVAGDDRYGAPLREPAASPATSSSQSPAVGGLRRSIGPPPPLASPLSSAPAASVPATNSPTTTPQDYGYGVPSSRPATPAVSTKTDTAETGVKPSVMMRSMLTAPPGSRLTGQSVRLSEVLSGASTRQEQSLRIDAYWDLCSSVADYYLGMREQDELQRLRSSVTSVGPVWQQAESELGVRIGTSQRAAVASQYRLASLMGRADASSLPLPGDLPHCGDYYARYDQVFAGRQSAEAQQLSELLPMRYEELADGTLAVTRAEEFLAAIASQRNGGDGTGTLRGLELLALRRRAFVQIARDYNRRIARYAELASPGQIDSERLIGMLIRREDATNTATRPGAIVPPPNRQSQLPPADSGQTFAEGWESIKSASTTSRDEAVKPASAESKATEKPHREHSLLVPSE